MRNIITKNEKDYIIDTCHKHFIHDYKINNDGSIDVNGHVLLSVLSLKKLPLIFNKVSGDFVCGENELTTLKGCPKQVGGSFYCHYNRLTNLEHAPINVDMNYDCSGNSITSLIGMPNIINGDLICDNNKLTSLVGAPKKVGGSQIKAHDNKLSSLLGAPTSFYGDFSIDTNKLPNTFYRYFTKLNSYEEISIYLKYQDHYEVWTPELNVENLDGLIDDIKEGLR